MNIHKRVIQTILAGKNQTFKSDVPIDRVGDSPEFSLFDFYINRSKRKFDFSNMTTEQLKIIQLRKKNMAIEKEKQVSSNKLRVKQMQNSIYETDRAVPEWFPITKQDNRKLEIEAAELRKEIHEIENILVERGEPNKLYLWLGALGERFRSVIDTQIEASYSQIDDDSPTDDALTDDEDDALTDDEDDALTDDDVALTDDDVALTEDCDSKIENGCVCCEQILPLDLTTKVNTSNNCIENRKQKLSEVESIKNRDYIEDMRNHLREEILAIRRNRQLTAANLNRGLDMDEYFLQNTSDEESQEVPVRDDLTPLDYSLPPLSHFQKKAQGIIRRSSILQKKFINYNYKNQYPIFYQSFIDLADFTIDTNEQSSEPHSEDSE